MSRTPPTPSVAPAPTTPGATLDTTFFEEDPSSDEEDDVVIPGTDNVRLSARAEVQGCENLCR